MPIGISRIEGDVVMQSGDGQTTIDAQLFELCEVVSVGAGKVRAGKFDAVEHELMRTRVDPLKLRQLAGRQHARVGVRVTPELHVTMLARAQSREARVAFNDALFCGIFGNPPLLHKAWLQARRKKMCL